MTFSFSVFWYHSSDDSFIGILFCLMMTVVLLCYSSDTVLLKRLLIYGMRILSAWRNVGVVRRNEMALLWHLTLVFGGICQLMCISICGNGWLSGVMASNGVAWLSMQYRLMCGSNVAYSTHSIDAFTWWYYCSSMMMVFVLIYILVLLLSLLILVRATFDIPFSPFVALISAWSVTAWYCDSAMRTDGNKCNWRRRIQWLIRINGWPVSRRTGWRVHQ